MEPATRVISVDLETTGLDDQSHAIYEASFASLYADGARRTRTFWLELSVDELRAASPTALAVGRYHERMAAASARATVVRVAQRSMFADEIHRLLARQVLLASNIVFDASFLRTFFRRYASSADVSPWHFKAVCVQDRLAGHLGVAPPYDYGELARRVGCPPPAHRHSSAVDAEWNLDVYEATLPSVADLSAAA